MVYVGEQTIAQFDLDLPCNGEVVLILFIEAHTWIAKFSNSDPCMCVISKIFDTMSEGVRFLCCE